MLIPSIFIFYNIAASTSVIITLYRKQRKVREALESASSSTREFLITQKDTQDPIPRAISAKEAEQLKAARKVYMACIRIALYPLAPIVWWIFSAIYYIVQYSITLTYKSDVQKMVKVMYLIWFVYPAVVFINFLVFITDPAVLKVVSEARKEIKRKLAARRIHATSSHDTLDGSEYSITKLPKVALSESFGSGTTYDNTSTASTEKQHLGSNTSTDNFGSLEDGQSISTSILDMYNDKVVRRIRADGDADSFMDTL
ncbi:hypothetical protein IW138_004606 [Coemansia sp. RSA 986]|nr:hypothetical protein IW138_004606 [Coemansia sp. RSA 986]